MTTIPRNHTKRIAELTKTLTRCNVFSRHNQYVATPVDPAVAWGELQEYHFARLMDSGNGKYTVWVHSEHWYELTAAENSNNLEAQGGQQ
jgi:hypothetical protein